MTSIFICLSKIFSAVHFSLYFFVFHLRVDPLQIMLNIIHIRNTVRLKKKRPNLIFGYFQKLYELALDIYGAFTRTL